MTFLIGFVGSAGLYIFFKKARLGIAMQAVVDNAPLVSLDGTNPVLVRRVAWMIGSCFMSVSGMLLSPKVGVDVNVLSCLVIAAFGAAAIGAFNNLPLTFVGGMLIGVVRSVWPTRPRPRQRVLQSLYINLPFVVLVIALIVIPRRYLIERGVQNVRRIRPPNRSAARSPWVAQRRRYSPWPR